MMTPPRLADRIAAIAGSVDLSGFTPYFSPVMFGLKREPLANNDSDDLSRRDLAYGGARSRRPNSVP